MLSVPSYKVNIKLDLVVEEVCRAASGHPWGEGAVGRRWGLPRLRRGCGSESCPALFFPVICTQVDWQNATELSFTLFNWALVVPFACPFTV